MRKLVVFVVLLVALFTIIRDFPNRGPGSSPAKAEIRSALVP